jgi:hypothetical protein
MIPTDIDPVVLEAAVFATRYELEAASGTIIVELVDDVTDEWVVRTARNANLFAEKELVRGRGNALRRALQLRAT